MIKDYFSFIGLGQCGMRIAQEFQRAEFKTSYINSDEVDARALDREKDSVLVLEGTGTGKSLKVGQAILEDNRPKFESFIKKHSNKDGMTIFIAGAGGGTGGSFIVPAVSYCKSLGHKVGVILTLPPRMLGIVPSENSLRTLQALRKENIDMLILVDNEYLLGDTSKTSSKEESWWGKINKKILTNFHAAVDILREDKSAQSGLGSIDKGELIRSLSYGKGLTDIRKQYLTITDCNLPPEELQKKLFQYELLSGCDYKSTLAYCVSIDVPENGNYIEIAKKIFDLTKKKFGNGIAILGMFTDSLIKDAVRVTMINSGLQLPKILQSRIKNLKRDEEAFKNKQSKVDIVSGAFEDLDLGSSILDDGFDLK